MFEALFGKNNRDENKPSFELKRVSSEEISKDDDADIYDGNIVDASGPADLFQKWDKGPLPRIDTNNHRE